MKKLIFFVIVLGLAVFVWFFLSKEKEMLNPVGNKISKIAEKPLDKYTFETLKKTKFPASEITFGKVLKDDKDFISYVFYFNSQSQNPSAGSVSSLQVSSGSRISGLANIPKKSGVYPVIIMFRGYVDKENYSIGEGTKHSGEVFSSKEFITLAPDFLGYGESDPPSKDAFEDRFLTYTTALSLLASLKNLNQGLAAINSSATADLNKIGIWGHSNGGHITLAVLEITGKNYPAVLWAPVSKSFPYSILYFTDEADDHGKKLRKVLAGFEKDYDTEKYSPSNFYSWINAPIQLHQGKDDEQVPQKWSDELYKDLKNLNKNIIYFTYPTQDHNFSNVSDWNTAVSRSIEFYQDNFKN